MKLIALVAAVVCAFGWLRERRRRKVAEFWSREWQRKAETYLATAEQATELAARAAWMKP